jgi:DNA polymerase-3 subunit epsilon
MAERLADLHVLVADCQSTGATPAHGALLEVGWALGDGPPAARLVQLPPGATIPRAVTKVTGLDETHLAEARPRAEVWRALEEALSALPRPAPTVIHFASFEERWLRALHAEQRPGEPFPFAPICTHRIAQRLLPDLPRRGLRALAGYFGAELGPLRRSADHVRATQHLWRVLVAELARRASVRTLEELRAWIEATPAPRPGARGFPMPAAERAGLPAGPGVYRMRRVDGSLLYVGKARSLKTRVRSYFHRRAAVPERTLEMLSQARRLEWTETPTALEAALLEQAQIAAQAPPYNVALRSDERRCWFADRALRELVERPDAEHPVGPVTDPQVLAGLDALCALWSGEASAADVAPLGDPDGWGPEPALLAAGVAEARRRHPEVPPTLRGLLALGSALWPLERGAREEREAREAREADGAPPGWSAERVADAIETRWARAAHAIRRARWLAILSESSVAWAEGDRRRLLVLERGRVHARGWLANGAPPPCPPGFARSPDERRRGFDVGARDRLRVLTTELRRLVREGAAPAIRTGPGALIGPDALRRLLERV